MLSRTEYHYIILIPILAVNCDVALTTTYLELLLNLVGHVPGTVLYLDHNL